MSFPGNIKRPTLLLDEQKCRSNIWMMAEKARLNGVKFRPHFKTHQSAEVGEWFREEGVLSIAVSSVGMARYFAKAGWEDITIAFPVNIREIDEINALAEKITLNLVVTTDESARFLNISLQHPVGIFIEIDTGYQRSGIPAEKEEFVSGIIRSCNSFPIMEFKGFLSHFGDTYQATGSEEIKRIYNQGVALLTGLRERVCAETPCLVSVGDTPSCSILDQFPGVDEIRPGNFVFYDAMQSGNGTCRRDQIAVCIAAPVVDIHPEREEVVVYTGAVHLSKERMILEGKEVYGLVVAFTDTGWSEPLDGCYVKNISQEHGLLHMDPKSISRFQPGDLIGILPVHSCLTANNFNNYLTTGGRIISTFCI